MNLRLSLSLFVVAGLLGSGAYAQEPREAARQSANHAYRIIMAIHANGGGQDGALRRCRTYMDDARSSEKLGAHDMALRNWDRAARGCRADAVAACRERKTAAAEQCEGIIRQAAQ